MSGKVRLRAIWTIEYEADPVHYEGCDGDPVKMAAVDQQSLDEGGFSPYELFDGAETLSVDVEPV